MILNSRPKQKGYIAQYSEGKDEFWKSRQEAFTKRKKGTEPTRGCEWSGVHTRKTKKDNLHSAREDPNESVNCDPIFLLFCLFFYYYYDLVPFLIKLSLSFPVSLFMSPKQTNKQKQCPDVASLYLSVPISDLPVRLCVLCS